MRYVKRLLEYNCYSDLHELFAKASNPSKEITESFSAYYILKRFIDKTDINYHIGDGKYCRTAALFSFMTHTTNYSIDPIIDKIFIEDWIDRQKVERFAYFSCNWQEVEKIYGNSYNLILVHSHINFKKLIEKFKNWKYAFIIPCCYPEYQILDIEYQLKNDIQCVLAGNDINILSPKNQVFIYYNLKSEK